MTRERKKDDEIMPYEPLVGLIEPYLNEPFEKLPDSLRMVVEDFFAPPWDSLRPRDRRSLAEQYDHQTDPALGLERAYWYELAHQVSDAETKIEEAQLLNHRGVPSEAVLKEHQLAIWKSRLANLKLLLKFPVFTVTSWDDLSDAKLAATLEDLPKSGSSFPAAPGVVASASEPTPWHLLATPSELIEAFGTFTGMDKSWFSNVTDTPKLLAARHTAGQGGKKFREPLFWVFLVMKLLTEPMRREAKVITEATGWRILKHRFPKVYEQYQDQAPDPD